MTEITIHKFKSLKENKDLRNQAMCMYMSGEFYPTEISDRLHVDIEELGHYVFGRDRTGTAVSCWKNQKDVGHVPKYLEVYEKIKPLYIKKTEKKLLDMVNKVIDSIGKDDEKIADMDTKDLVNLITSAEKIDKIGRLEEGRATSHVVSERTTFSLREIVENKKLKDVQGEVKNVTGMPRGKS